MLQVGLSAQLSITSNAQYDLSDTYILVYKCANPNYIDKDTEHILVSNYPIKAFAQKSGISSTNTSYTVTTDKYLGINTKDTSELSYLIEIAYSDDLQDWVTQNIYTQNPPSSRDYYIVNVGGSISYGDIIFGRMLDANTQFNDWTYTSIQTNFEWTTAEATGLASYSSTINLPHGMTESRVNELINESLNATTSIAGNANNLQQQAINYYQQYTEGSITLNQLTVNLNNIVNQLNTLNQQPNATLADKVAINNALTNTQIVNDSANKDAIIDEMQNDLQVSSSITTAITGKINQANQTFQNYSQGAVTQSEAVTQINQYITYLTGLISPQSTTADIEAINTAINTINGIKNSITSYSDLDKNTSESVIQSDQEELDYLDELTAETLGTIQDISPEKEFSEQQKTEASNILSVIWQNDLIKKLIPICACFMVVCVVLGIRYKV